jgi:hypothetical protein
LETHQQWAIFGGFRLQVAVPWPCGIYVEQSCVESLGNAEGKEPRLVGYAK